MFVEELHRYSRPTPDAPSNPVNLFLFFKTVRQLSIPTYIQAYPYEPLHVYLELSSKQQHTNRLQACFRHFSLRPQEIILNNAFCVYIGGDDEVVVSVHARAGVISGRIAQFVIRPDSVVQQDLQQLLSGSGQFIDIKAVEQAAVLQAAFAAHSLSYLQANTFFDLNSPPRMFVPYGYYQISICGESHYLNGTLLNRPYLFPGYVLRVSGLGGRLLQRGTLQRVSLAQLRALLRQRLIERLTPAVEARNDVLVDRNAVTLNLDRISLLVTAHTGVFPIAQKYLQITNKPGADSLLPAGEFDFYYGPSEDFKFASAAYLVFYLILQAQVFFSPASSEYIDEPFPTPMSYSVCCGAWQRGQPLYDVQLTSGLAFGALPTLEIDNLAASIAFSCEEIGFTYIDYNGMISADNKPPPGYFGEQLGNMEVVCGDLGQIEVSATGIAVGGYQQHVEDVSVAGKLVYSQTLLGYPVNAKLRLYKFQQMISGYFNASARLAVRIIGSSTYGELQTIDSPQFDTAFQDMRVIEFYHSFCGALAELCVQLLEFKDQYPVVVGYQFLHTQGEAFYAKCAADGYYRATIAYQLNFDEYYNKYDFFELVFYEPRLDSYFDPDPPEIAYLYVYFTFTPASVAEYPEYESDKAIALQSEAYWQAMKAEETRKQHVQNYVEYMHQAFNTPERALALATLKQNCVEKHFCINDGQKLNCDILHDLQLSKNGDYSLMLIYPNPLVLQALGFTVEFEKAPYYPCFYLDAAKPADLRINFSLDFPKKRKFSIIKIVFALYQQGRDFGKIHCMFSIAYPEVRVCGAYYIALPYYRDAQIELVFRKRGPYLCVASPNTNGAFLDRIDVPVRKTPKSKFKMFYIPASLPVSFPGFYIPQSRAETDSAPLCDVAVGCDTFITLYIAETFISQCGKGKSVFFLTDGATYFVVLLDFLPYCVLECHAGTRIALPQFEHQAFVSYPPHLDGKIHCLARGKQHVHICGDSTQFVCCINALEAESVLNKYFLKVKGGEIKQIECKVPGRRIQALSEFPSLVKVLKCHITDEGWALTVQLGAAYNGYRTVCRFFIHDEDEHLKSVILLEVVWE